MKIDGIVPNFIRFICVRGIILEFGLERILIGLPRNSLFCVFILLEVMEGILVFICIDRKVMLRK